MFRNIDGSRYGAIHPGSPIFCTFTQLLRKEGLCKCFINAVVIAYETAILLSSAIQPSHYNMGSIYSNLWDPLNAAVGVATLLGFNRTQLKDTFSAAAITTLVL